jgi:muramoyltetrapeptide carboxypeptidase
VSATRKPKALRSGDLIGVAAPAGPVDEKRLERGVAELEALGFAVRVAMGALDRTGFTAGSPEARQGQLEGLLGDPEVAAIVCARGGAGAGRVLARLDLAFLGEHPKPLLGYSDITWLHLALGGLGIPSLHGPMVAKELADGEAAYARENLWHALTGEGDPYASAPGTLRALRGGSAEGVLRGGCLAILAAAAGTPWALRPRGEPTLLFIEDVDEPPFRVDRMLLQLQASGGLEGVRGIVFGEMKGCVPERGADYTLEETLLEALEGFDGPVAFGLPSGHASHPNVTLPLGVRARLDCGSGEARFEVLEAPVE